MSAKLAKRLLVPDGLVVPDHEAIPEYVETYGPEVAEVCAAAGYEPDPQQQHGLNILFGIRPDGLPASFAFGVISCRQNLKTGLLKQASLGWLFVTEENLIVWSSHEMDTTRDALRDLEAIITECPALSRHLPATINRGIYDGKTEERIELRDGRRIKFKARTMTGGRGLSGDKTILDEGFALLPSHVGSLIPTMNAKPHGQVVYASSAGKADSDVLRDVRDRGRAKASPRLGYLEWLAPKEECGTPDCEHPKSGAVDCALDRERLLIKANPTITTGRMTLETLQSVRQELPPAEFARECLGWWDDDGDDEPGFFTSLRRWRAGANDESEIVGAPALAVAVSVDRRTASVAAAGENADGLRHLEPIYVGPFDPGYVVAETKRLAVAHDAVAVAIDGGGPGADLVDLLVEADVPNLVVMTLDDVKVASSEIYDLVEAGGRHAHLNDDDLNDAVKGAVQRNIGDRFAIGRRKSEGDVSPFEAVTFASWAFERENYDVLDSVL